MTVACDDLRAAGVPVRRACALIGRASATHYRHRTPPVHGPARPRRAPENGQSLTGTERAKVLALINTPKYADLTICQIWARELDAGNYSCSKWCMCRIAKSAGQTRERPRQATHPAKVKPELLIDGHSQVWTWDITKLRGPAKGVWYHLYVTIDIFSRYNPSWLLSPPKALWRQRNSSRGPSSATARSRTRSTPTADVDDLGIGVGVASQPTVLKWRGRYVQSGIDGLVDEPRPGREPVIDEAAAPGVARRRLHPW